MGMIRDIRNDWGLLEVSGKSLRSFGMLFSAVLLGAAGLLLWRGNPHWLPAAAAGIVFLISGLLFSSVLVWPYRSWMLLAFTLGWLSTRLILLAAYYGIMTPTRWLLRGQQKDILDERIDSSAISYWKKHESVPDPERYRKQF